VSFRDGSFNNLKVPLSWRRRRRLCWRCGSVTLLMSDPARNPRGHSYSPVRKVADTVKSRSTASVSAGALVDSGVSASVVIRRDIGKPRLHRQLEQMNDLKAQLALERNMNSILGVLGLRVDRRSIGHGPDDQRRARALRQFALDRCCSDSGVKVVIR